jgi:hypothetical protein
LRRDVQGIPEGWDDEGPLVMPFVNRSTIDTIIQLAKSVKRFLAVTVENITDGYR